MLVNCAFCTSKVEKTIAEKYNNKNYHTTCLQKYLDREKLLKYVCELFGLKGPGPIIYSQLKNFLLKNPHYTYNGILLSLQYFYGVKKNSTRKANEGIGIVPYVYDEAQNYYKKINSQQEKFKNTVEKQLNNPPEIIVVRKEKKEKSKKIYDLEQF